MDSRLLAFLGIAIVLTLTPGADMALVARIALTRGRKAAWLTSLGIISGLFVWGIASAIGIAALLNASAMLYTIFRFAGAAYLIWLGIQAFMAHRTTQASPPPFPISNAGAYRQGLINNLLNPKIGVFYTTFLPQFIAPGQPVFLTSVLLSALHGLLGIVWLTSYAAILAKFGEIFRRPAIQHTLERITGVVLIGLGLRLAFEQKN